MKEQVSYSKVASAIVKNLRSIAVLISLIILLVACNYDRYEKVHVKVFFSEEWMKPIETDVNYFDIYKDRIELIKWVVDKKGKGKFVALVFEKSEYDSLYFKPTRN